METRRLKSIVMFIQTVLSFVLSRKIVLDILSNFIPHETWTIDDKDPLGLQNKQKILSKRKTMFAKAFETVKTTTIHVT